MRLGVFAADKPVMEFDAADYAEILERHGKGNGKHAFDIETPPDLWRTNAEALSVRPVKDVDVELQGSPLALMR